MVERLHARNTSTKALALCNTHAQFVRKSIFAFTRNQKFRTLIFPFQATKYASRLYVKAQRHASANGSASHLRYQTSPAVCNPSPIPPSRPITDSSNACIQASQLSLNSIHLLILSPIDAKLTSLFMHQSH